MCNLPKIVVRLKQVGSLLHRIDILVASCFASALDGDGACGGESEQGVLVNIARITRSCLLQPPSTLNIPQSRVSFVTQNSPFWTVMMMSSAMFCGIEDDVNGGDVPESFYRSADSDKGDRAPLHQIKCVHCQ